MDIVLVEGVAAVVGAIASAGGGRILWVRSRSKQQLAAIAARNNADVVYLEFGGALSALTLTVETTVGMLGPTDSASFRDKAGKTLDAAAKLDASYTAFAYADNNASNPDTKHGRGTYVRLTSSYNDFARKLRKMVGDLDSLSAKCAAVQAKTKEAAQIEQSIKAVIADARAVLDERISEEWVVLTLEAELRNAGELAGRGSANLALREVLTAIDLFGQAEQQAAKVAEAGRSLPQRLHDLVRRAATYDNQYVALGRDFERAEAGVIAVRGIYAEAAFAAEIASITAARLRYSHMPALIAQLRDEAQPERDAWDAAETTATEIEELVAEVSQACRDAITLRESLDEKMLGLRRDAGKLRNKIAEVQLVSRDRDGDQKRIRKALKQVDAQLVGFIRSFDDPTPDPGRLETRLEEFENLVTRLKQASKRMDEWEYDDDDEDDHDDTVFRTLVAGAAAAVGIDLLID